MSGTESLRRRRERLIAEAEGQREDLAHALGELEGPLRFIGAGIDAGRALRRQAGPALGVGAVRLRPTAGRAAVLVWRLIVVWQAARLVGDIASRVRGVRVRLRTRRRIPDPPGRELPDLPAGGRARAGHCVWKAGPPRAGVRR